MLDVVVATLLDTDDIGQIKRTISNEFQAQEIELNPFVQLLGPIFVKELSLSDHAGPIRTATFSTIARYMSSKSLVDEMFVLKSDSEGGSHAASEDFRT